VFDDEEGSGSHKFGGGKENAVFSVSGRTRSKTGKARDFSGWRSIEQERWPAW